MDASPYYPGADKPHDADPVNGEPEVGYDEQSSENGPGQNRPARVTMACFAAVAITGLLGRGR